MSTADPSDQGFHNLYPFLRSGLQSGAQSDTQSGPQSGTSDLDTILAEVRRSTMDKIHEIVSLRQSLIAPYAEQLARCARRMADALAGGGQIFTFGNGGSSSDAQTLAQLFACPPSPGRPAAATSLAHDVGVVTALSNDIGYDVVFARQLAALGRAGDIAIGLSTSGGSENILNAMDAARRKGMLTIGLAGYDGGRLAQTRTIDFLFVVPSTSVHRIQEAQTTLYHVLWELTQQSLAGEL